MLHIALSQTVIIKPGHKSSSTSVIIMEVTMKSSSAYVLLIQGTV
jgi:hypothetical protein